MEEKKVGKMEVGETKEIGQDSDQELLSQIFNVPILWDPVPFTQVNCKVLM